MSPEEKPVLRTDLDIIQGVVNDHDVFVIRDSIGLIEHPVVLSQQLAVILTMMDGTNTVKDMEIALTRAQSGLLLQHGAVERLVAQLDVAFIFDNARYREARSRAIRAFTAQTLRKPTLVDLSYPSDPVELGGFLDSIFETDVTPAESEQAPVALIAPHIDLDVGRKGYAAAYAAMAGIKPDLVIILGTGHRIDNGYFCITGKDFVTPLGTCKTDQVIVEKMKKADDGVLTDSDFPHRQEHSIEIQLLFLQHILKDHPFSIVPVLCSSFLPGLKNHDRPSNLPGVDAFLSVLRETVADPDRNVLVVASVDLSHVGPKFGHGEHAEAIVKDSETHDRRLLDALCAGDVSALWEESRAVDDRFNVCGFPAIATMLEVLPPSTGRVLHYETWHEKETSSAVSFASAIMERSA